VGFLGSRTYVRSFLYILSVTKHNITIVQDVLLHNMKEREVREREREIEKVCVRERERERQR
jgi:hypothetical protein